MVYEAHEIFASVYKRFVKEGTYNDDSREAVTAGRVRELVKRGGSPVLLLTATPRESARRAMGAARARSTPFAWALSVVDPKCGEASDDLVAADRVCCRLMQVDEGRVRHLDYFRRRGWWPWGV